MAGDIVTCHPTAHVVCSAAPAHAAPFMVGPIILCVIVLVFAIAPALILPGRVHA